MAESKKKISYNTFRLYQISMELDNLLRRAEESVDPETGEIKDNEEIWERIADLSKEEKSLEEGGLIEDIMKEVVNREALLQMQSDQIRKLTNGKKRNEKILKRLKSILLSVAKRHDGRIETKMFKAFKRTSKKIKIVDEKSLPDEIDGEPIVKVVRKPILKTIKRFWNKGIAVLGTEEEKNETIVIKYK